MEEVAEGSQDRDAGTSSGVLRDCLAFEDTVTRVAGIFW